MESYMYILECRDGSLYVGSTIKLEQRIIEHNTGEGAGFTRKRLPVRLLYTETFDRIEDAFQREQQARAQPRALIISRAHRFLSIAERLW